MTQRIGLIQTRGIGDIIIALPIADYYAEAGYEVLWPIDKRFVEMFRRIKPSIRFLPVDGGEVEDRKFFLDEPLSLLREHDCDKTIILYSYLSDLMVCDTRLASVVKVDEYKYAIARVPFERKWTLKYDRDIEREERLFEQLDIKGDFVCVHDQASTYKADIKLPSDVHNEFHIVRVTDLTDSPFDWLLTFERASKLFFVESCFSNLVEQMNLKTEKYLFPKAGVQFTPVYKNGWIFSFSHWNQ